MRNTVCMVAIAGLLAMAAGFPASGEELSESELDSLRETAAGDPKTPEARKAAFALANALLGDRGADDPETLAALRAATSFYAEDPRSRPLLPQLAVAELDRGDSFGAHVAFSRLVSDEFVRSEPALAARAIRNALEVEDYTAAFLWSRPLDVDRLDGRQRTDVLLSVLLAANVLGRLDVAREAAELLESTTPESLHVDADALFAAADTFEALGLLDEAADRFLVFANIHAGSERGPEAMLAYARLLLRLENVERARKVYDWLLELAPDSSAAHRARLDLLELDGGQAELSQLPLFLRAARKAPDPISARETFDRLLERFIGAGHPLEAVSAVGSVVRELGDDDESLIGLAAKESLERGIEAAIALLESRSESVSVAAVAATAREAGIPVPREQQPATGGARVTLGLEPSSPTTLDEALEEGRRLGRSGRWSEVRDLLDHAIAVGYRPPLSRRIAAESLIAEALWRQRLDAESLARISKALDMARTPDQRRLLIVLRADVLFAQGRFRDACPIYEEANEISGSRWVDSQIGRCHTEVQDLLALGEQR